MPGFRTKRLLLSNCDTSLRESPDGKKSQMQCWDDFRHKLDCNYSTGRSTKSFGRPSCVSTAKDIILLHPAKCVSQQWGILPWKMERVFRRLFEHSNFNTFRLTWCAFGKGKNYHCHRSFPSCGNIESWKGCRLWWNPAWDDQSLKQWRNYLANSCVSSGFAICMNTGGLTN